MDDEDTDITAGGGSSYARVMLFGLNSARPLGIVGVNAAVNSITFHSCGRLTVTTESNELLRIHGTRDIVTVTPHSAFSISPTVYSFSNKSDSSRVVTFKETAIEDPGSGGNSVNAALSRRASARRVITAITGFSSAATENENAALASGISANSVTPVSGSGWLGQVFDVSTECSQSLSVVCNTFMSAYLKKRSASVNTGSDDASSIPTTQPFGGIPRAYSQNKKGSSSAVPPGEMVGSEEQPLQQLRASKKPRVTADINIGTLRTVIDYFCCDLFKISSIVYLLYFFVALCVCAFQKP
jgi:hypothetical protein